MDNDLLNDDSVISSTTSSDVDYTKNFTELHSDLVSLNSELNKVSTGIDFVICILVVLLVSRFVLDFFSRGFK